MITIFYLFELETYEDAIGENKKIYRLVRNEGKLSAVGQII